MNTNLQGKEKFYYLVNKEGYKILEDYINRKVKVKVQCPKNHIYKVRPCNFIQLGNRCPICKESKGEKLISGLMDKLNIEYEKEKTFNDLKYKSSLRFDFQIFINGKFGLIEYDGIQHFEPINFTGKLSEEQLLKQFKNNQLRDQLKNDYCKKNNIPFLRIPYYLEVNEIENKIKEFIKKF